MTRLDKIGAAMVLDLGTITTRDVSGRHFTAFSNHWTQLESLGYINVHYPRHDGGAPYAQEFWTVEVTPLGQEIVDSHPELFQG